MAQTYNIQPPNLKPLESYDFSSDTDSFNSSDDSINQYQHHTTRGGGGGMKRTVMISNEMSEGEIQQREFVGGSIEMRDGAHKVGGSGKGGRSHFGSQRLVAKSKEMKI